MKNYINYQYINLLRRDKNMTYRELGEAIGLSHNHAFGVCKGRTMTTLPKLIEISKLFNVPITNLILDTPHGN